MSGERGLVVLIILFNVHFALCTLRGGWCAVWIAPICLHYTLCALYVVHWFVCITQCTHFALCTLSEWWEGGCQSPRGLCSTSSSEAEKSRAKQQSTNTAAKQHNATSSSEGEKSQATQQSSTIYIVATSMILCSTSSSEAKLSNATKHSAVQYSGCFDDTLSVGAAGARLVLLV